MDKILMRIKLISLFPVRLIHIIINTLMKSQLAEIIFIIIGMLTTFGIGFYFMYPFDESWKYWVIVTYVSLMFLFEVVALISLWEKLLNFLFKITNKGNVMYINTKKNLGKKSSNYSMGLDEDALVTIDYFIKKDKDIVEIEYIHN